jgi:alkanesulfonate monooxygenase SsuD/methylene tetrahydromethanopterin reductase-like flavin-dependent oxidoreductase (luciferase family)
LRSDDDYRANQVQARQAWAGRHGDYWRAYRTGHPEYAERNRLEQRRRDRRGRAARLAKMDASTPIHAVPSGTYRLVAETGGDLAKMDAWTVKITVISRDYASGGEACAILQREDVIGSTGPPW